MRVLVVDDNRDLVEALKEFLGWAGHVVTAATSGETALELALWSRPEAVVCDLNLSGEVTGFDVASQLRRRAATSRAFQVAVTGTDLPDCEERARASGFDSVLHKPFKLAALEQLLAGGRRRRSGARRKAG
jgi:CheY-like chemotaxis protein